MLQIGWTQIKLPTLIAESGRADLVTQASRAAAWRGQVNEAAAFPIPDLASLLDAADEPPEVALLLGVARQESTFNTWGMSYAGAQGLLQLMPGTARLMARAMRMPYNRARLTAERISFLVVYHRLMKLVWIHLKPGTTADHRFPHLPVDEISDAQLCLVKHPTPY
jgi:hypothetical protein